jgi:hypothetical protein
VVPAGAVVSAGAGVPQAAMDRTMDRTSSIAKIFFMFLFLLFQILKYIYS